MTDLDASSSGGLPDGGDFVDGRSIEGWSLISTILGSAFVFVGSKISGAAVFIVIAAVILVPGLILGSLLFLISLLVGAVRGLLSSGDERDGPGGPGGRNGTGRENVRVIRR